MRTRRVEPGKPPAASPPAIERVDSGAVERWYRDRGFLIVERGWAGIDGTVDLIVRNGGTVVFCDERIGTSSSRPTLDGQTRGRINRMQSQWAAQQRRQVARMRYDAAIFFAGDLVMHQWLI